MKEAGRDDRPAIARRDVALDHAGAKLIGRLCVPEGTGRFPGVLVMSNAHGLGDQAIEAAELLATLGYAALATDMYGGGAYFAERDEMGRATAPLWADPALRRDRVVAWHERLKTLAEVDAARLAAVGYCFGGLCVLELARSGADTRLVASFHGLLETHAPAPPGAVKAQVAVFTGRRDPWVPATHVAALRAEMLDAGARFQITEYSDAWHSFTDHRLPTEPEDGKAYEPFAAVSSWAATIALLRATLEA